MTDPLEIAITARERADEANRRLDRMNGSIDKLRAEVARANATGEQILLRIAGTEGEKEGATSVRSSLLDSRRALTMVLATLAGSGLFTALFTYVVRS